MTKLKARPTTYKGIEMRSRLEAGFAAWLDRHGFSWAYEPRAFASAAGQYLPDFRIDDLDWLGFGICTAYVEVKPESWGTETDLAALRAQMLVIHESEPDATLLIVRAGGPTVLVMDSDDYPFAPSSWAYSGTSTTPALAWVVPTGGHPLVGEFWKVS